MDKHSQSICTKMDQNQTVIDRRYVLKHVFYIPRLERVDLTRFEYVIVRTSIEER